MECPVCFEVFDTPLLLPGCGHTLCRSCAEMLITEGNFLRCPECRLVYQLRQGVKSLPKNVALERTIDEHMQNSSRMNLMCDAHPDDAGLLYCRTCEKSICLKCFFSNTLRKGQTMHTGHQVDTCEDAFSKEKRLLQENLKQCESRRNGERDYIHALETTQDKLKVLLEEKLSAIDHQREELVKHVNQTSSKLKFTLKGTMVRDKEFLEMALQSSKVRLEGLEKLVEEGEEAYLKAAKDQLEVNTVKEARKKLEEVKDPSENERPLPESFLKLASFDTDISACIDDPKKALSYQTEPPKMPNILLDNCVISDEMAYILVEYNETVRVKTLTLYFKEAIYKGMSEKDWESADVGQLGKGRGHVVLKDLNRGTMYKVYVIAKNDFGSSPQSKEVWFRTVDKEIELRST